MPISPVALLRRLEATRLEYGPGRAVTKFALLRALARTRLASARQVLRLHEHLCFSAHIRTTARSSRRPSGCSPASRAAATCSAIVRSLPGLERWSADERSALARVILAKGGRRDGDDLARFEAHPKLGAALRRATGA
jgi:hypothetical protein